MDLFRVCKHVVQVRGNADTGLLQTGFCYGQKVVHIVIRHVVGVFRINSIADFRAFPDFADFSHDGNHGKLNLPEIFWKKN